MTATLAPPSASGRSLRAQQADAIRALSIDAIEHAGSGHPGMPMGFADAATALVCDHLRFDPDAPDWPDRDRLVLSAGHGSMLLYSLLHLTGYAVSRDDLRQFRQLGARTAGHPEWGHCPGVETTTGPLGQGIATAVGMAIAERMLNARYGDDLVDHRTYVVAGDGCLMEGISHEAVDLAGHLRLRRLVVLFDDNQITIDGPTSLATSIDQARRFQASGWNTISVDGHDQDAVSAAIAAAHDSDRPTLVSCRTVIGFGAPNRAGTSAVHGSPLGAEEAAAAKAALGWAHAPFEVPGDVAEAWRRAGDRGRDSHAAWRTRLAARPAAVRERFGREQDGVLPADLGPAVAQVAADLAGSALASRQASQRVLTSLRAQVPALVGGSADLTGSNGTRADGAVPIGPGTFDGDYVNYGIREHAMAAAMNGLALHGGLIPFGGTFLAFADYSRPAIRLAALMGIRVVHVMTHDSIGLGEDGPTHQPVEQLASLRAMPNVHVIRPADARETAEAWECALRAERTPTVLVLSRQALAPLPRAAGQGNRVADGGYLVHGAADARDVTIVASGSEVQVALAAAALLAGRGLRAAVVSVPCMELLRRRGAAYAAELLGSAPRVAVEAAVRQGWDEWLRPGDAFVGMAGFGASGPAEDLYEHFGITPAHVAAVARDAVARRHPTETEPSWR